MKSEMAKATHAGIMVACLVGIAIVMAALAAPNAWAATTPTTNELQPIEAATARLLAASTVSISVSEEGPGVAQGPGTVLSGNTATVSATPDAHARFEGWFEAGTLVSSAAEYSFVATSDRTLVARFSTVYDLSDAVISGVGNATYTGARINAKPVVTVYGTRLVEGRDYKVRSESNVNAGKATFTVYGISANCVGQASGTFSIQRARITGAQLKSASFTYNGKSIKPALKSVVAGAIKLKAGDYQLTYRNNCNAGRAQVTISGRGNFTGNVTKKFKISPKKLGGMKVKLAKTKFTYSGKAYKPSVKRVGGKTLKKGKDFKVKYKKNRNAGTASVVVLGKGNYTGKTIGKFTIKRLNLAGKKLVLKKSSAIYTGRVIKPGVKSIGGQRLKASDYKVKISKQPKQAGTYFVCVKGKGNCKGLSKKSTFKIRQAKNPVTVVPTYDTPLIYYDDLQDSDQSFDISDVLRVKHAAGDITYEKVSGDGAIDVSEDGTVTVRQGWDGSSHSAKVKVTAAGNRNYRSGSSSATFSVDVRGSIKGNISYTTGEKIYHVPGDRYYDVTEIDEDEGERWFTTEDEARDAGWRHSYV